MIDPIKHYSISIEREEKGLRELFNHYLPEHKARRVLNICAGVASEEPTLLTHFGNPELISIDNDIELVNLSKELKRDSVVLCDVKEVDKMIPGRFDLVIGRNVPLNPKLDDPSMTPKMRNSIYDPWPGIFRSMRKKMTKDSLLLLSLLRDDEFKRAEDLLRREKFDILIKDVSPIIVPTNWIGVTGSRTTDHYIIIARATTH